MKTLIIGNVGSGKTTLAKKLSKYYGIKHFEIDSIVHNDLLHQKRLESEQKTIIKQINKDNNNYILEGVLRKNLTFLIDIVDNIIILNIEKPILKKNIKKRYIKQRLGLSNCSYPINKQLLKDMYKWVDNYDYQIHNDIIKKHASKIILLKNKKDIKNYLKKQVKQQQ